MSLGYTEGTNAEQKKKGTMTGSLGEITKDWLQEVCNRLDVQNKLLTQQNDILANVLLELQKKPKTNP